MPHSPIANSALLPCHVSTQSLYCNKFSTHTHTHTYTHLVSICMTAYDDGFLPGGHETRDVGADDGLTEHGASQDVPDGAVGTLPHLLQLKL